MVSPNRLRHEVEGVVQLACAAAPGAIRSALLLLFMVAKRQS